MADRFDLPDIGDGLVEAEILAWRVRVGDEVAVDQILVEVETAKAVVELPSPYGGVVLELGGQVGDVIEVGAMVAIIGASDEADGSPPVTESELEPSGRTRLDSDERGVGTPEVSAGVRAMPIVRKLAAEHDIDLAAVEGSGPGGAVTPADIEALITGDASPHRRVPMTRMRRTIAEHMAASWREIPHVTTFHQVDASALLTVQADAAHHIGAAVPVEALVIRAVIPALRGFPDFNATLDGDDVVQHLRYDVGFAVDTPAGLIVPVVRSADQLDLASLVDAIRDLAQRAQDRKLGPAEASGATFTITNIGAIGGGSGTPIIPLGTTAILSTGRAAPTAVVVEDVVTVATIMPLSLSFDHRVIDGAAAHRFMETVMAAMSDSATLTGDMSRPPDS